MNLPRPTRTPVILGLCLAILAGLLAYEHHQLSRLSNSLAAAADKESLDELLSRLDKVDERLDSVDERHLVSNEDFRSGQQALSNRIDSAQAYAKQATETAEDLSHNAASTEELVALKASLEKFDRRLHELSQSHIKQSPEAPPQLKTVVRKPQPSGSVVAPQPPPSPL